MWFQSVALLALASLATACTPSVTTVSGTHAPATVCSGDLIFADDFENLDLEKWQHEITLAGGGNEATHVLHLDCKTLHNALLHLLEDHVFSQFKYYHCSTYIDYNYLPLWNWEFQYYSNNRTNSFVNNGLMFIRPSLTSDKYSKTFLTTGLLNIEGGAPADRCTNPQFYGCERQGTTTHVLNPVMSARLRTVNSFSFRYGKVETRAKMPAGDWLWPAIWLMPAFNAYGSWPASGEIDLVESRGNRDMFSNGVHIGTQEAASTLHFGPFPTLNAWDKAHWAKANSKGFDTEFHNYQLEWTPDFLKFSIDGEEIGRATPGAGGFWEYGGFNNNPGISNPWRFGSKMAPFDEKFYIIMNLAVGGTNGYFPDNVKNPFPKPWSNTSPAAITQFWNGRAGWLPTWKLDDNDGQDASLQVDYIRVWAL